MACLGCGESVAAGARFCSTCGRAITYAAVPPPPQVKPWAISRSNLDGLYRPREGRMVAGVCKGFSQRYGWDVSLVRLVLVLSVVLGAGVPLLAYVIGWVLMPNGQFALPSQAGRGGPDSMRV